jgi:hypothetical protein
MNSSLQVPVQRMRINFSGSWLNTLIFVSRVAFYLLLPVTPYHDITMFADGFSAKYVFVTYTFPFF